MASDLTLSQTYVPQSPHKDAAQDSSSAQDKLKSNAADAERAMAARRQQFVDRVVKMHGLEHGRLVIEKDTDTGRFIHKLVDPKSGDVVRQWPDDAWLDFARSLGGAPEGLWVNTSA